MSVDPCGALRELARLAPAATLAKVLAKKPPRSRTVNMHEAKTRLSELVSAAERGEVITIARNGTPVVVLVPATTKDRCPAGIYRGRLKVHDSFNDPLPAEFSGGDDP